MLWLWRNKKATGSATGDLSMVAADSTNGSLAPNAHRLPVGDLQPSPHPSPKGMSELHPDDNALDKDGKTSAHESVVLTKQTPCKTTLKWRRNQARIVQKISNCLQMMRALF